jgi:hypothetical protein
MAPSSMKPRSLYATSPGRSTGDWSTAANAVRRSPTCAKSGRQAGNPEACASSERTVASATDGVWNHPALEKKRPTVSSSAISPAAASRRMHGRVATTFVSDARS